MNELQKTHLEFEYMVSR